MWIAEGNTSFEDCDALTWSLGCTSWSSRRLARVAMTSLAFMLLDVPDPVWNTSIGKCASWSPRATSAAASWIASASEGSSTPSWPLTVAATPLIEARAPISSRSIGMPEIGKFCTARCVWARHKASAGTCTSPIESCSVRKSLLMPLVLSQRGAADSAGRRADTAARPPGRHGARPTHKRAAAECLRRGPLDHATRRRLPLASGPYPCAAPVFLPLSPQRHRPRAGPPCPAVPSALSPLGSPVPPSRPRPGTLLLSPTRHAARMRRTTSDLP